MSFLGLGFVLFFIKLSSVQGLWLLFIELERHFGFISFYVDLSLEVSLSFRAVSIKIHIWPFHVFQTVIFNCNVNKLFYKDPKNCRRMWTLWLRPFLIFYFTYALPVWFMVQFLVEHISTSDFNWRQSFAKRYELSW